MSREDRIQLHHERIEQIIQENRVRQEQQQRSFSGMSGPRISATPREVATLARASFPTLSTAQHGETMWSERRRGSWLADAGTSNAATITDESSRTMPIVIVPYEDTCVYRAASFLAEDIEKISGVRASITDHMPDSGPSIVIQTAVQDASSPWESYVIDVSSTGIRMLGSNPRGTAFGVYELCERLGVDPIYIFSGISPEHRFPLLVKPVHYEHGPPTFKYRGFFHDDEDILPRPTLADGKPDVRGRVPDEWYARFFETALRLKMNMVAPYTRTIRTPAVQKMASDWGLYLTSHHYDTLLSDPYHFDRGGLAKKRGVEPPTYDWLTNRAGITRYWGGGVEETRELHCIWPIGLRGTEDFGYKWPADWTVEQRAAQFNEAFATQWKLLEGLPKNIERLTHFTMYTEMLPLYQTGLIKLPEDTIIVWPDDNDGRMRGLPASDDASTMPRAKHNGIYYHLAYLGSNLSKQLFPSVPPARIAQEFSRVLDAKANEFCLVNVSELREFTQGARMIADICWGADTPSMLGTEAGKKASDAFLGWWCREYFDTSAAGKIAQAYNKYYDLLPHPTLMGYGADICSSAAAELKTIGEGRDVSRDWCADAKSTMTARLPAFEALSSELASYRKKTKSVDAKTFFFESLELPVTYERLGMLAALDLVQAEQEATSGSLESVRPKIVTALVTLDQLEQQLRRANRWPMEDWYDMRAFNWSNRRLMESRQRVLELLSQNSH